MMLLQENHLGHRAGNRAVEILAQAHEKVMADPVQAKKYQRKLIKCFRAMGLVPKKQNTPDKNSAR